MTDHSSPEKSPWGWKALIIFCILGGLFMLIFWLAISNEPDYMPSQQNKQNTQQHAFKNAPVMSEEAMQKAQADKVTREASTATASEMHMTEEQHAHMDDTSAEPTSGNTHGH